MALRATEKEDAESIDFEVTPWAEVEARPIVAVSEGTGGGAKRVATCAWAQFGSEEAAQITVHPEVRTAADVTAAVEEAATLGGDPGALVIYTLADPELCTVVARECAERGIPCLDALQPLLSNLEEVLKIPRIGSYTKPPTPDGEPLKVFVASDSSGTSACEMVRSALRQFPGSGVKDVTVCPEVRSLEEIRLIAEAAGKSGGLVPFTFASTGMSRFMRQQCEIHGARFVDLYQPVILAMEIYLDFPAIGVPGGYQEAALQASHEKWQRREL